MRTTVARWMTLALSVPFKAIAERNEVPTLCVTVIGLVIGACACRQVAPSFGKTVSSAERARLFVIRRAT